MKCWMVDDDVIDGYDDLPADLWCHADTRSKARHIFANRFDFPYLYTKVSRFPAGDDITISPAIALYTGIYHWHECFGPRCYERVYGDRCELNGLYSIKDGTVERAAVDDRGHVYCTPDCAAKAVTT